MFQTLPAGYEFSCRPLITFMLQECRFFLQNPKPVVLVVVWHLSPPSIKESVEL